MTRLVAGVFQDDPRYEQFVRLKQKPEDFSVKESFRFEEVPQGAFFVYLMDKQKLSTFEAIERLSQKFGLRPGSVSYCGLKDKQGRTEQLVAVEDKQIDMQDPDLRLKFLGRTDKALSAENTTSNRFSVTARAVKNDELQPLSLAVAEVNRLGVINYFDSQRFGGLKHGQGFIAKDLIRGDHEAALKNFIAKPSPLDRSDDAKVKTFWAANWGDWDARCPYEANRRYFRIFKALKKNPTDYLGAFTQIDADQRAMQIFSFQSWLWNEGVRRLLQLLLPREHLFPMPYQAGTLLFHHDAASEVLQYLRSKSFPLLSPHTVFDDEKMKEAAIWALGKEKLTLEQLKVPGAEKLIYFKTELRPIVVYPHKLVLGKTRPDELNKPLLKLNIAFTLPPGAYATLVVKRLFHFSYREDTPDEIKETQATSVPPPEAQEAKPFSREEPTRPDSKWFKDREGTPTLNTRPPKFHKPPYSKEMGPPPKGFRQKQADKKAAKVAARAANQPKQRRK